MIFTIKEKNYYDAVCEDEPDPLSGGRGVAMTVSRRVISCLGIPLNANPANVRAYSLGGNDFDPDPAFWRDMKARPGKSLPIPVPLWTESMKDKADQILPRAGSDWKYKWFFLLVGFGLLFLLTWGLWSGRTRSALDGQQAAYLAAPRPGDILVTQVVNRRDNLDKAALVAFEIAEIRGDTLFLRQGDKRGSRMRVYQLPQIHKAALQFVSSGNSFASEAKPFTRPFKGDPTRLHDPSAPDVNLDVEYIIRPRP